MSMKKVRIKGELSHEGIQSIIKQLDTYKTQTLQSKIDKLLKLCANEGIKVARASVVGDEHHFDQMVNFRLQYNANNQVSIIGEDGNLTPIHREWYTSDGQLHITQNLSPILMLEYGSAGYAVMGVSSFQNKSMKGTLAALEGTGTKVNAVGWQFYVKDDTGNMITHNATAVKPRQPMYRAEEGLRKNILKLAKRAFRE